MSEAIASLCCCVLFVACATTGGETVDESARIVSASGLLTYSSESAPVSQVVREVGRLLPSGIVVMNGMHTRVVGPYDFRAVPWRDATNQIATDIGAQIWEEGGYLFLYPAGYEGLNRFDAETAVPADFVLPRGAVSVGADTPLFNAFALFGQAFDTTIVADNAIASARTGEIVLPATTGREALEAVIKSARLDRTGFRVAAGDGYLLFHSVGNSPRQDVILNRKALSVSERRMLKRRVDVHLPEFDGEGDLQAYATATRLGSVLHILSEQCGVTIVADESLLRLPVNPTVINNLPLETALRLILNQWLIQDFGIDVTGDTLRIREAN